MSTVFSAVLIAAPPAFLTGWLLSKALFRQIALRDAQAGISRTANSASTQSVTIPPGDQAAVRKLLTDRQQAQQLIQQLREQLASAQQRLQPLQGDVQLLKEAVAEREHQLMELRRKLQLQNAPPELPVGATSIDDAIKERQQQKATRDALAVQEQRVSEQAAQLAVLHSRLQRAANRAGKWRTKARPVLHQFRQQRAMIQQLREELRQRDLLQQSAALSGAPQVPSSPIVVQPLLPPVAPKSPGTTPPDYRSINQENLQMLRGLGPALHRKLNERGIYRLGQLAELTPEESYRLCRSLGVAHKTAIRNDWSAGARELLGMVPPSIPANVAAVPADIN